MTDSARDLEASESRGDVPDAAPPPGAGSEKPGGEIVGAFSTRDGLRLAWTLWGSDRPRAAIMIIHGFSEHRQRYRALASALTVHEFSVFAYDQRGHGESEGPAGDAPAFDFFVDDLRRAMARYRQMLPPTVPMILLGHSMGGLVTLRFLQRGGRGISGAVVSAPWLRTVLEVPRWKRVLGTILRRLAPGIPIRQRGDGSLLTRDPEIAADYENDPLVHSQITPRLYYEVEATQREVLNGPKPCRVPLLFFVPTSDSVTDPDTTLVYAGTIDGPDVSVERLEGFRHEPFNEVDRERVFQRLVDWVEMLIRGDR